MTFNSPLDKAKADLLYLLEELYNHVHTAHIFLTK